MDAKQIREKRANLVLQARAILDTAETEGRDLTAEENQQWDQMHEEARTLGEQVARIDQQERVELEQRASQGTMAAHRISNDGGESGDVHDGEAYEARVLRVQGERQTALRQFLRAERPGTHEFRALQMDSDPAGGYTVRGEQFVEELIKAVDDMLWIRQMSTVHTVVDAESLGVPTLDADPADADWTAEVLTGREDSAMSFGKRDLHPHPLAKRIKVSQKLMRASALPIEQIVRERLAYKFAVTEEKGFLTGSGVNQPLGLFTASVDGIPTSRDVDTGNTDTAILFDGLIEAKYSLKGSYWARATWMFHRDAVKMIAKLKDGEGQYIWQPSVQAGQPDRILNMPLRMSEYVPNTFTSGLYVGLLGDLTWYWIADALSMTLQRLVELYAETNQVGFIGRLETDGMPVLAEAFVRVTMA